MPLARLQDADAIGLQSSREFPEPQIPMARLIDDGHEQLAAAPACELDDGSGVEFATYREVNADPCAGPQQPGGRGGTASCYGRRMTLPCRERTTPLPYFAAQLIAPWISQGSLTTCSL